MLRTLGFLLVAGAVIYGLLWLVTTLRARAAAESERRKPVAPDDDPEFLAQLDLRLRQERRRRAEQAAAQASEDSAEDTSESPGDAHQDSTDGEDVQPGQEDSGDPGSPHGSR